MPSVRAVIRPQAVSHFPQISRINAEKQASIRLRDLRNLRKKINHHNGTGTGSSPLRERLCLDAATCKPPTTLLDIFTKGAKRAREPDFAPSSVGWKMSEREREGVAFQALADSLICPLFSFCPVAWPLTYLTKNPLNYAPFIQLRPFHALLSGCPPKPHKSTNLTAGGSLQLHCPGRIKPGSPPHGLAHPKAGKALLLSYRMTVEQTRRPLPGLAIP